MLQKALYICKRGVIGLEKRDKEITEREKGGVKWGTDFSKER